MDVICFHFCVETVIPIDCKYPFIVVPMNKFHGHIGSIDLTN